MANQEQPLSAYNVFHELQQEICDVLNKSQILTANNVQFIPENRCDIDYQIKNSLKKQGLACVCLTPNARYLGHTGTNSAYQLDDLTLQIVEYTPINRAKNQQSVITGLDLANYCAEILAGPNSVIGFGNINTKSIEQGEDNGLLVTKAIFQTALTNGQQPIIYIPFVTRDEMEQYVGDGKLTFTKDGVQIGSFTSNQKNDLSIELPNSGVWGQITGNIEDQQDLIQKLNEKASKSNVDAIEEKIPAAADASNQLADKAFVNSSINNYVAFYLTKNANGDAFGTYAELTSATKFWNAGVEKTPTKNDYLVVLEDETKTTSLGVHPTTRYTYQGEWPTGQFEFQYIVNNTALTQAQVDAINSGITKSIVDSMVMPSTTNTGFAANADYAIKASDSEWASNAINANYASQAGSAESANQATHSETAEFAIAANKAEEANTALSATYAPDYTPLSTFNQTLGNLSSIIHEI